MKAVSALIGLLALLGLAGAAPVSAAQPLSRAQIRQAEERLAELGFWSGPADGVWDEASKQALIAFQKLQRARATGRLTPAELNALQGAQPIRARMLEKSGGPHVEVDLAHQVLFLVDAEGKAGNGLPISSGNGKKFRAGSWTGEAVTPCGQFEVFSRRQGWRTSPLGEMFNPLYIVGGIAIHGSESVPPFPASHGCIRVPMFAARRLPGMIPPLTPVFVYGCGETQNP